MNERIEKLVEQAAINAVAKNFTGTSVEVQVPSENWVKEFAELIVLESSKWIVDNSIAMEQLGPEFFAMGLCKHFGIK
jgi:hypothetical protein